MPSKDTKVFGIRLKEEVIEKIKKRAEDEGTSVNELVGRLAEGEIGYREHYSMVRTLRGRCSDAAREEFDKGNYGLIKIVKITESQN